MQVNLLHLIAPQWSLLVDQLFSQLVLYLLHAPGYTSSTGPMISDPSFGDLVVPGNIDKSVQRAMTVAPPPPLLPECPVFSKAYLFVGEQLGSLDAFGGRSLRYS